MPQLSECTRATSAVQRATPAAAGLASYGSRRVQPWRQQWRRAGAASRASPSTPARAAAQPVPPPGAAPARGWSSAAHACGPCAQRKHRRSWHRGHVTGEAAQAGAGRSPRGRRAAAERLGPSSLVAPLNGHCVHSPIHSRHRTAALTPASDRKGPRTNPGAGRRHEALKPAVIGVEDSTRGFNRSITRLGGARGLTAELGRGRLRGCRSRRVSSHARPPAAACRRHAAPDGV